MKLIIAIVRPFTIDKILVALEDIEDFPGITITDVEGFGRRLRTPGYDKLNPFKPKKQIEIIAKDELVEPIIAALRAHAHTGKIGDGMIVVLPLEEVVLL